MRSGGGGDPSENEEAVDPNETPFNQAIKQARAMAQELSKAAPTMTAARRHLVMDLEEQSAAELEEVDPVAIVDTVAQLIEDAPSEMERSALTQLNRTLRAATKRRRFKAKSNKARKAVRRHNESASVSPQGSPPMARTRPTGAERAMVREWERDLAEIVRRAVAPLVRFVGAVAVELREDDIRRLLVWRDPSQEDQSMEARVRSLVSKGAKTVEDFMYKNRDLGRPLLVRYLKVAEKSLLMVGAPRAPAPQPVLQHIGPGFDLNELDLPAEVLRARAELPRSAATMMGMLYALEQVEDPTNADLIQMDELRRAIPLAQAINRAATGLKDSETESTFAPAWCFECLGDAVFRKLINDITLAAFDMALAKVRRIEGCSSFTIKELILSEQVHDQFAFLVASEWLNTGDDTITVASKRRGPRSHYFNLMLFRQHLGLRLDTCAIWFETVRARPNPILRKFAEKKAAVLARMMESDPPASKQSIDEARETLDMYGAALPKRELVQLL